MAADCTSSLSSCGERGPNKVMEHAWGLLQINGGV